MKIEKETFQDTVQTYDSICSEKFVQAKNILELYQHYEDIKEKNKKCEEGCIKQCQRALKLAITRTGEQQSRGSQQLSQDAQMIEAAKEQEQRAAKEELLNINAMLLRSRSQVLSASDSFNNSNSSSLKKAGPPISEEEDEENYAAMWQSSSVQFPQLTGATRTAVLREEKHKHAYTFQKKKKLLLPKGVSASMTNHI